MGTPMASEYVKVIRAGKGWTEVLLPDGTVERREGARNWRNNNPGNIEYGKFAQSAGAIGTDGRFAVFPTYDAGREAKAKLLFESPGYRNKTVFGAINRWAPPFENNTNAYASSVANAIGVDLNTPIADLNEQQRDAMLSAMERVEGFRPGRVNGVRAVAPDITPEITPEFRGPLPADQIPVPATGFGQANVPMASGGVDPARFGGMAVPFTPDTSMKKYMPGAVAAQEASPPQLPGTLAPMLGSTEIDPPQPPMPMQGPPMQAPAQGPASMLALANLFGSMGTEQPQFSPVQIRGPSPEQANALASFIEALKKRVV